MLYAKNFNSFTKKITKIFPVFEVFTKLNQVILGRFRSFLGRPRKSTSGQVAKNRLDRPRIDRLTRLVRTMCCEKYYYFMDVLNRTHRKLDYLDTIWYFIPLPLSFGQGASIHLKVARDMASYFPISLFIFLKVRPRTLPSSMHQHQQPL